MLSIDQDKCCVLFLQLLTPFGQTIFKQMKQNPNPISIKLNSREIADLPNHGLTGIFVYSSRWRNIHLRVDKIWKTTLVRRHEDFRTKAV